MNELIQGAGGGGGGGKGGGGRSQRVPVEAADSLRSKAYAKVLDLVCEGEIEGLANGLKSIYLDGTPIENDDSSLNFSGVEVATRTGTQAQSYIPGQTTVENTVNVATEVKNVTSVTRQVTNANLDAVTVTIGIPGLSLQNTSNGDINGTSVQIAIDLQSNGGGFVEVLADTITGKTTTRYQRSYRIELTGAAPWDIRVRRITADSASSTLQDKTWWDTYTEIIDAKLRYPNSAIVGIKIDASQFQNIPTRGYDMKLLRVKVPSNYNPTTRAYTGSWDGTFQIAWTDNPAWCFYDLVTNDRYGLGGLVDASMVDKWAMYQIGKYCDELVPDGFGGTEPRFTCNLYLQTRAEAYKVLQDFASIFRGMVFWSTGAITATQDAPSDPVALYTAANVIEGKFTYQGSSLKARHTVALVTWCDPDDMYRQKVEYVEDADGISRYGVQQVEVTAIGCTSRGQAHRVGRWLLYSERLETETVQFAVGLSGAMVRPGNVIKVADATRAAARLGGRVSSSTTSSIVVDKAPTPAITGWTLYCTLPNGTVESRVVSSATGKTINVAPAFSTAPTPQGVWILSGPSVDAQTFRVLNVAEDTENGNYSITALKHEPLKYAAIEQGLTLQPRDFTLLNNVPAAPGGLTLGESLYTYQAEVRSKISVGWTGVEGVYRYFLDWRKDNGNWNRIEVRNTDAEILDTTPGAYDFAIYSSNPAGITSGSALTGSLTALGKTAPPSNVTSFSSVIDPQIGVTLLWDRVADLDLDAYEIRTGGSWDTGTLVSQIKGTSLKIGLMPTGSVTYYIKALDTSEIYSATAASTTVTISAAGAPTVSSQFVGDSIVLTWTAVAGSLATQSYEIRYGASWAAGTSLGTIKGTSFTTKATWSGSRTFWISAIDISGNVGAAGQVSAIVNAPGSVSMTQEVIDNNVLLRWGDATATLPIDFYELRRGATWAGATVIGRVSARFSAIFESVAGTFTYWVRGYDVAGNEGAASSVAALVNQPPDYALQYNLDSTFSGTKTNMPADGLTYLVPVSTTETWQEHFVRNMLTYSEQFDNAAWNKPGSSITQNAAVAPDGATTADKLVENSATGEHATIHNSVSITSGTTYTGSVYLKASERNIVFVALNYTAFTNNNGAYFDLQNGVITLTRTGTTATISPVGNGWYRCSITVTATATITGGSLYIALTNGTTGTTGVPSYTGNGTSGALIWGAQLRPGSSAGLYLQTTTAAISWSTPQDQINAGFPVYAMPGSDTASYEEVVDYGTVLAATKITATLSYTTVAGTVTVTPTISVSATSATGPWTDYAGASSAFVANFRWAKIRYDFASTGGDDLITITGLNIRFDVKLKNDAGTVTANSADSGGTTVNFNVAFVDVQSITLSPKGTAARIAVYDFVDVPNPTSFKVLLFDTAGNRVSGDVAWSVKGV